MSTPTPPIRGGQGRTPGDIASAATLVRTVMAVGAICAAVWIAWPHWGYVVAWMVFLGCWRAWRE